MILTLTSIRRLQAALNGGLRRILPGLSLFTLLILFPTLAMAQSPFDTGFTAMQTLFTGTVAKVASLIAIVVGGYQLAPASCSTPRSQVMRLSRSETKRNPLPTKFSRSSRASSSSKTPSKSPQRLSRPTTPSTSNSISSTR
jgi:type IV secretory pathway VirB2 component (pilin)